MNLIFAVILLITLALLWLFYDKFTRRGAVPLGKAFRDFTTWFGLIGVALSDWVVMLLQWLAGFWEPLQATVGPALAAPGLSNFVMAWSALMLALKFKAQTPLPKPSIPDFPRGADGLSMQGLPRSLLRVAAVIVLLVLAGVGAFCLGLMAWFGFVLNGFH